MGNWAQLPWIGIFNPKITESAQSGYYLVYLFREDMEGVYLSLNQGVTNIRDKYGDKKAVSELYNNSSSFREKIKSKFDIEALEETITLGTGNYAPFYEAGNIYAKYYSADDLPSDDQFISDLNDFIGIYDFLANSKSNTLQKEDLKIIEDRIEIKNSQEKFLEKLYQNADEIISTDKIGFPGGRLSGEAYWSNDLGIWVVNRETESGNRYWNGFGIVKPEEDFTVSIVCEINFPKAGINRQVAGAFAKDDQGNIYVVHRGKIGGNYSKKDFVDSYSGEWKPIKDGDKESDVVVIGRLDNSKLPELVRDFVFYVNQIKSGEKGIRGFIEKVLKDYISAKTNEDLGREFARLANKNSPINRYLNNIANDPNLTAEPDRYEVYVTFGAANNLVYLPSILVFDEIIASEDTFFNMHRYYILYIFREDMKGVYLSLNQSHIYMKRVLESENRFTKKFDKNFNDALNDNASILREYLLDKTDINDFTDSIDLKAENAISGPSIEAGNIFAKYYTLDNLPSEEDLKNDFKEVLKLLDIINSVDKRNVWLLVTKDPKNWEDLENKDKDTWSGHQNTRKGDLLLMYNTAPRSRIDHIFEAAEDAREDPYYDNNWNAFAVDIKKKYDLKNPVSIADMKQNSILSQWSEIKTNFQGTVFKVPENEWKEIKKLIIEKNPDCEKASTFCEFYSQKGYYFEPEAVENFLLSLKVKQLVILTGNSGTGKTKLAQLFAQYLSKKSYKVIPVGANWTENRHIIGFYNLITEKYQITPALDLILESRKAENSNLPYFLILDEMNLSHVERYFADFLSALESGETIPLHNHEKDEIITELKIPNNLMVVGTVNVDETTYMFSPKVLDRANTLEFETYSAQKYMQGEANKKPPKGDWKYLENPLEDLEVRNYNINQLRKCLKKIQTPSGDDLWLILGDELETFQETLKKAGFDFGFRVINEILRFMYVAWKYEKQPSKWDNWERYFDAQIKQKMLPKLHGSERVLGEVIQDLSKLCLDNQDEVRFPNSHKKLKEMEKVLFEQRYVSFIN